MLSHDEQRQLAEIEQRLRAESPDLSQLFDGPPARPRWRIARIGLALVLATAATALATVVGGPNAGGLAGAVTYPLAGLYGWRLYGCPGQHH